MKFNKDNRSERFDYEGLQKANHQYFDMDHLYKDKYSGKLLKKDIWMFMINIDKNVGKTYQMNKMMIKDYEHVIKSYENKETPKRLFFLLTRTDTQLKIRISDINNNPHIPFFVKSHRIYCKSDTTRVIGQCGSLSTLHNFNGDFFTGYYAIYYDEYRSKVPLSERQLLSEFTKLGTFCDTYQRDKLSIRLYMFGNNEADADIIAEGFLISKGTSYCILKEEGVAYFNLGGLYRGLKEKGQRRAVNSFKKYSTVLSNFIDNNQAMESRKGLIENSDFEIYRKNCVFIILFLGVHYHFYFNDQEEIYYCESLDIPIKDIDIYTVLRQDGNQDKKHIPMDVTFASDLDFLYKNDKIKFWKVTDRNIMEDFLDCVLRTMQLRELEFK